MRRCAGPTHPEPVWLPLDEEHWSFHLSGRRAGKPRSTCRACRAIEGRKGTSGLVSSAELLPWIRELIWRCGTVLGVEKRHGIPDSTLSHLLSGKHHLVQKRTATRIFSALIEQRRLDRQQGTSRRFHDALVHHAVREGQLRRDYGI